MNEIKEGEYIRTKQGYIAKVEDIEENIIMCDSDIYGDYEIAPVLVGEEQIKLITKHSFNIIDLIEANDYVNGHKVRRIDDKITIWIETGTNLYCGIYAKDIKTIVTKELFNSVMYKVVE